MGPRGMAADQLLAAMGGGGGEEAPLPPEEAGMGGDDAALAGEEAGAMDLESALAGVDAAIDGMDEATAREIRTHLEAIRDIASREPAAEQEPAPEAGATESELPVEDPGAAAGGMSEEPIL